MKVNKPYLIGLTGGIACGKSNAARELRNMGLPIIDADAISRALTEPCAPALPLIQSTFGNDVLFPDGSLDRKKLGTIVFSDPTQMEKLNQLLHPMIFSEMAMQLKALGDVPIVVLDIPLLHETGMDKACDEVWCVYAPPEVQLLRLLRRGLSEQEARQRMASQLSAEEKARRSDIVINTCSSRQATRRQLERFYTDLIRRKELV